MAILLDQVAADVTSNAFQGLGSQVVLVVRGDDFGGGTVAFEVASMNDSEDRFEVLTNGSFTANGSVTLDYLPQSVKIRADLSGATAPDNVFAEAIGTKGIPV